jgi:hypothetical protein
MNGRVLVMCPSRDRPEWLKDMIASVQQTATHADIAVYVDDDQREMYDEITGATVIVGPRTDACTALNELARRFPDYEACGLACDDSTYVTHGWDQWVLARAREFKGGIGAIAPYSGTVDRMDFPWLTRRWIEVAGAFVPLGTAQFYYDIALEIVGEATQIAFASPGEFRMDHYGIMPNPEEPQKNGLPSDFQLRVLRAHTDAREAFRWIAIERRGLIAKLREAICSATNP